MDAAESRSFFIECEPVCDRCGHGVGLHADAADIECVACVERGDGADCPSYASLAAVLPATPSPQRHALDRLRRVAEAWR